MDNTLLLVRNAMEQVQSLGNMYVFKGVKELFSCKSLELPWRNNQVGVSCIPEGTYDMELYNSPRFGWVYLLKNVPGRSFIEIHPATFHYQSEGCIFPGDMHTKINADKWRDVRNSRATHTKLLSYKCKKIKVVNYF